jgi:hypothetical protein
MRYRLRTLLIVLAVGPLVRNSHRRWFRFTLRSALLLTTVLCFWLGIVVERGRRQRSAVAELLTVFAEIRYDCDTVPRQTSHRSYQLIDPNYLHSVTWLVLDAPAVNDDVLAHLEALPSLQVLMMTEGSDVSSEGLRHLLSVPDLRHLVLASGTIEDRGLNYVVTLADLEELDIHYQRRITDAGILRLAQLKKLRRLTISDTGVTQQGIVRLRAALPNCEIDFVTQ